MIVTTSYLGVPWYLSSTVALALFFFLTRSLRKHFTATVGNGAILFWIISQRILPPMVVAIPFYMVFQAVGLSDTITALIIVYAVTNLPIVVWLMYDFFTGLPAELEESAMLEGATRFGIFWEIVLPLTRSGLAAATLLCLILNWNEYLFAVFLSTSKAQTMPIMIQAKNAGERGTLWWEMCAIIVVMIIPVILMFRVVGLSGSYIGIILLYTAFNLPFTIWMMKSFFDELSLDVEDAARIDGSSGIRVFFKICLPQVVAGLAATFVFGLILTWNEFLFALLLKIGRAHV